jgi:hypothetical protein
VGAGGDPSYCHIVVACTLVFPSLRRHEQERRKIKQQRTKIEEPRSTIESRRAKIIAKSADNRQERIAKSADERETTRRWAKANAKEGRGARALAAAKPCTRCVGGMRTRKPVPSMALDGG